METELLRTFATVARAGSFTAAARELGYVQSTVSGHLQALNAGWVRGCSTGFPPARC